MFNGGFMSEKSLKYLEVLAKVKKNLSQQQAAKDLSISIRQVYRLYKKFLKEGPSGFLSKKYGKPSNHQLSKIEKSRILELVTCEKYAGFGPTFMNEKLLELHAIKISIETTRQLMIESGVWHPDKEKRHIVHQQRERRAKRGELMQIDGSPHRWVEEREEACCLILFVDDATGARITVLESLEGKISFEYKNKAGNKKEKIFCLSKRKTLSFNILQPFEIIFLH